MAALQRVAGRLQRFLSRDDQLSRIKPYELFYNNDTECLPILPVAKLGKMVVCGCTGPDGGITQLDLHSERILTTECVAGISDWHTPQDYVYGISLSLYEEKETTRVVDGVPHTSHQVTGDPVADVYGAVVRSNNVILAVADGVSWGKKPRLAARCAVRASIEYISDHIDEINASQTSATVFGVLKNSLLACQDCIMENKATLTTLSVAMVCQLGDAHSDQWGVFVVSIGDSPVFVYSISMETTIELTVGSNPRNGIRDPKNSGGALGPAIGVSPDLENLSFSFIPVMRNDVVVLMTDGISDNLLQMNRKHEHSCEDNQDIQSTVCHNITSIVLSRHNNEHNNMSAQSIAACLMNEVVETTEERRRFNSYCMKERIEIKVKAKEDKEFAKTLSSISGKLDHATILAYQIGRN